MTTTQATRAAAPADRAEITERMEAIARIQVAARELPAAQRDVLAGLRPMTWDTLATTTF